MMTNGFYLDSVHQIYSVQIAGISDSTSDAWYEVNRGAFTEICVTDKSNIFKNEQSAKKEAFLRLLKNKESK
jgi:hypothetical protein